MVLVPETYYQFVMDYAPYVYVVPPNLPDVEFGRATFAAAFAIDFLFEAYNNVQFENRRAEISTKIASLADWILTQQCTEEAKAAYGGFKSTESSTYYSAIDACRAIPSLLKAYELTNNPIYLDAAKLAGATFLYNMQHKPNEIGIHDKYYGGFARAVTATDAWLHQMDIECLYGIIGLKALGKVDSANVDKYELMMADAVNFYRCGLENFYLYHDPKPYGDSDWHRAGLSETMIYDDVFAYALLGLYDYEGWSVTCQKVYTFLNGIGSSQQYPAYNPAVCWAGYLDVVSRCAACDYYDAVTCGILWRIRKHYDKPSFAFSMQVLDKHQDDFMFWGVNHADYTPVENKMAMAAVCWLGLFYLNYEYPMTRFTQILGAKSENLTLSPVTEIGEKTSYGEALNIRAVVLPTRIEEIPTEAGYVMNDYFTLYTFAPLRKHDKICRRGVDYEVLTVQTFCFKGETAYFKANCRRLVAQ